MKTDDIDEWGRDTKGSTRYVTSDDVDVEYGDWLLTRVDPNNLKLQQEKCEKSKAAVKDAKEKLDQEGYQLSHECIITVEKNKKKKPILSPELKTLIERYKIVDKVYSELVTKDYDLTLAGGLGHIPHVKLFHNALVGDNAPNAPLWVLRGVCNDCGCTEGLSIIIDGRDTD